MHNTLEEERIKYKYKYINIYIYIYIWVENKKFTKKKKKKLVWLDYAFAKKLYFLCTCLLGDVEVIGCTSKMIVPIKPL